MRILVDISQFLSSTVEFDEDSVTPGVVGFAVTALVGAVVILLAIDLSRRVRRQRYRAEANALLDAEEAEAATQPRAN